MIISVFITVPQKTGRQNIYYCQHVHLRRCLFVFESFNCEVKKKKGHNLTVWTVHGTGQTLRNGCFTCLRYFVKKFVKTEQLSRFFGKSDVCTRGCSGSKIFTFRYFTFNIIPLKKRTRWHYVLLSSSQFTFIFHCK